MRKLPSSHQDVHLQPFQDVDDANLNDLNEFLALQRPEAVGHANFTAVLIANGTNPQTNISGSEESALDIQFTTGLTWPIPITFYQTGGTEPYVPSPVTASPGLAFGPNFLGWLTYVSALSDNDVTVTRSPSFTFH